MKRLAAIICAAMCLTPAAYAYEISNIKATVNYSDNSITCTAELNDFAANDTVTFRALKPGYSIENSDMIQGLECIDSANAGIDGQVGFCFKINDENMSGGNFNVYFTAPDGTTENADFYWSNKREREDTIKRLFAENADINALITDDTFIKPLSLDNELFVALDKNGLALQIKRMLANKEIEQSTDSVQKSFFKADIFEALNQKRADLLFDSNQKWKYDNAILLSDVDKNGITVYKYYSVMTDKEKQYVKTFMQNRDVKNENELYLVFAKGVMVSAVSQNTSGWGFLRELLNSNAKYVGIDTSKYDVLSDTNKNIADAYVLRNQSAVSDIDSLQKTINNAVEYALNQKQGGGASIGGGSNGGGAANTSMNTVLPDVKESDIFNDMENAPWAKECVKYLTKNKIINGYDDGSFKPFGNIKREEFIKLAVSALGLELSYCDKFSDVTKDKWYAEYVGAAYNAGITDGYSDGRFGTGENITRQDAAVIIARAIDAENAEDLTVFDDENDISNYAVNSIKALFKKGIISGNGTGCFLPKNMLTRAEAAMMIYNMLRVR